MEENKNYKIGLGLVKEKKFLEAQQFFRKCLEEEPNNINAYYQLLMNAAILKDYNEYKSICMKLREFDNPRIVNNANYCLYLLQYISDEKSDIEINVEDILLEPEEKERNQIRQYVYNRNFRIAGDKLHDRFLSGAQDDKLETLLESKLIALTRRNRNKKHDNYRDLMAIKYYEKLLYLLSERERLNIATKHERYLKKICLQYVILSKGEEIEFNSNFQGSLFELIESGNYLGALNQSINYNKTHNNPTENNLFTLALADLCWLYKKLYHQKEVDNKLKEENKFNQEISNFYKKLLIQRRVRILGKGVSESDLEQLKAYDDDNSRVEIIPIKDENNNDRYAVIYKENHEYKGDIDKADKLFNNKKYSRAIEEYLKILQSNDVYPDYIYKNLANAYYNTKEYKGAVIFGRLALNVENDLEKREEIANTIKELKQVEKDKSLPKEERELQQFSPTKTQNVYNFKSVNDYVIENNLDVTTACSQLGISEEDANKFKLIYAREYYKCHMEKLGNLFIKSVEESSEKSDEVNILLRNIKKMKGVYLKKPISNEYNLPFNIQPERKKGPSY